MVHGVYAVQNIRRNSALETLAKIEILRPTLVPDKKKISRYNWKIKIRLWAIFFNFFKVQSDLGIIMKYKKYW